MKQFLVKLLTRMPLNMTDPSSGEILLVNSNQRDELIFLFDESFFLSLAAR